MSILNDATILQYGSDMQFRLRAFSDYCNKQKENLAMIIAIENEAISLIDETSDEQPDVESILSTLQLKYPSINFNGYASFESGYATIEDVITHAITSTYQNMNGLTESKLSLINAAGTQLQSSLSFEEVADGLKTSLHSITSLIAANEAVLKESISDKIQVFNDKMSSVFANAYSDLSNTSEYLKNIVLSSNSVLDYFSALKTALDVEALAEDESIELPENSDISKYCGANPITGLSTGISAGLSAVGTAINAGVKIIGGVLAGVGSLIGRAFSWIGNKIHEIVSDPYDIEEIDKDADSYTVDGWSLNFKVDSSHYSLGYTLVFDTGIGINTEMGQTIINEFNSKIGHVFKYSTWGAESLLKFNSFEFQHDYQEDDNFSILCQDGVSTIKPRSFSPSQYESIRLELNSLKDGNNDILYSDIANVLDKYAAAGIQYLTTNSNEKDLLTSFICGCYIHQFILSAGCGQIRSASDAKYNLTDGNFVPLSTIQTAVNNRASSQGGAITNFDFVKILSGYNHTQNKFDPYANAVLWNGVSYMSYLGTVQVNSAVIIGETILDQLLHPLNFHFVPYRDNKEGFSAPRFSVKTDATNMDVFQKFAAIVTVVVVVAITVLTGICIAKTISRKLYYKALSTQSQLNAKLWNGEKLTWVEQLKYKRATRRLDKSKYLSSGLQSLNSESSTITNSTTHTISNDVDLQKVINLIVD